MMGSMGPKFLSAGLLVFDAGLSVISDSISFVGGSGRQGCIVSL